MQLPYMIEAVRAIKLDHISMTYIYKVFEYLLLLWIVLSVLAASDPLLDF